MNVKKAETYKSVSFSLGNGNGVLPCIVPLLIHIALIGGKFHKYFIYYI